MGPRKKVFNLHRVALERHCPYFAADFKSPRPFYKDKAELDSQHDDEDAWRACIEFIYTGSYSDTKLKKDAILHANVYLLADRLSMADLKKLALSKYTKLGYTIGAFIECIENIFNTYNAQKQAEGRPDAGQASEIKG